MQTEVRRTTCNRDCPDACGILADIRGGEIHSLRGDPDHPVTSGFLCTRTSLFPRIRRGKNRLFQAQIRRGGRLEPVGLEEALDVVAARLAAIRAESGPAAIFHYRSGGSLGLLKSVADRFFEALGPCTTKSGDICSGAGEAAQIADLGRSDSNDFFDLRESRHVLLWGKNPFVSNLHLVPLLHEARGRGATVTTIDPVHHRGAGLADVYIQPRPGGDLALALGVARVLIDSARADPRHCNGYPAFEAITRQRSVAEWAATADVRVDLLHLLADRLADGPTAILVGWGMQRRSRGAATVRALDALSALTGNLFRPGGGASFYFARRGPFATVHSGAAARHVREPLFARDVLDAKDPPIRALWVTAGNPVAMLPDSARVAEAIETREFVVVVDPFLTETAERADVVLPVPDLLEDDDLVGAYGHHWIGESRPLVPPPEGVVQETELFRRLAARLDLGGFDRSPEDWKREMLAPLAGDGITLESLRAKGALRPGSIPQVAAEPGRIATPSGKVELMQEVDLPADSDAAFPLWLFSNSTKEAQASQWSRPLGDHLPATVHPDTAAAAGLAAGAIARLESEIGGIDVEVVLDPNQRRDAVIVPKGGSFARGQSANALIPARPTDMGLGAAYLDCRVRLVAP